MARYLFKVLDARECEIIYLRFFKDLTQLKIGGLLQLSQVHVSRLQGRAFHKMREAMREPCA
ncbi:MAG: sigma factor-like helix-turn-helix DNA-binding protein [Candidatus Xenobia bacterium]